MARGAEVPQRATAQSASPMSTSMRKLLAALVLPLLMLFAQQGAVRHELGHFSAAAFASTLSAGSDAAPRLAPNRAAEPVADHLLCNLCLAFAHLAASVTPSLPPLPMLRVQQAPAAADAVAFIAADAPAQRSRGPPAFL